MISSLRPTHIIAHDNDMLTARVNALEEKRSWNKPVTSLVNNVLLDSYCVAVRFHARCLSTLQRETMTDDSRMCLCL